MYLSAELISSIVVCVLIAAAYLLNRARFSLIQEQVDFLFDRVAYLEDCFFQPHATRH